MAIGLDVKDAGDVLARIGALEKKEDAYRAVLQKAAAEADDVLAMPVDREGDPQNRTERFLKIADMFAEGDGKAAVACFADLVRLYGVISATMTEQQTRFPLTIDTVHSFRELMEKYMTVNRLLRRVEFDIEPGLSEAYEGLRAPEVSPMLIAEVVYSPISYIGHREALLSKLANKALERGDLAATYLLLRLVQDPGEITKALIAELEAVFRGEDAQPRE